MTKVWTGKIRLLMNNTAAKHDLGYLLAQARPDRPLADRLDWMELLSAWVRAPLGSHEKNGQEHSPLVRIKFLLQLLERQEEWKGKVGHLARTLFVDMRGLNMFAFMGLLEEKGFADQMAEALVDKILPMPPIGNDLGELLQRIFPAEGDSEWVAHLSEPAVLELKAMIEGSEGPRIWKELFQDLADSLQILATRIAAVGASPSIWARIGSPRPSELPFVRLLDSVNLLVQTLHQQEGVRPENLGTIQAIFHDVALCEQGMDRAMAYLELNGVNMGLIFRLEHQRMMLRRLMALLEFLRRAASDDFAVGLRLLLSELVRASRSRATISSVFRDNIQRLALRVVEHTGSSGEHYITRTRSEYWHMLLSAAGGGILTVGTTVLKYGIGRLKAPAFIEALANWCNYGGSFLLMQASHFTLATKQPSMTAPALAKKLSLGQGSSKGLALAYEIRHIVRSQFAAAAGNVGLAVPTALLLAWGMQRSTGQPMFPAEYAVHAVESLNPFATLTVFFAALTGVLLWLSSMMAGWVENWIAFQRIPLRLLRNRPLKRVFGEQAGVRCADFLSHHISGIVGNITLGFFLAFVPFLGKIMGLPLEVRHVTLSSAQVAISVFSAWDHVSLSMIAWAALGIVYTGLLNFGVSFWLALSVATRAQRVRPQVKRAVMRRFFQLLGQQPLSFIFPTKRSEEEGLNELIAASAPQAAHSKPKT